MTKPIVWTIAGSDSSGGAGIQTDLKMFQSLGVHGCSVITAVTAQSSKTVTQVDFIDIRSQLNALRMDPLPAAIKIGMLGKSEIIKSLQSYLIDYSGAVILDPVMVSSSGKNLFAEEVGAYRAQLRTLFPHITLLTPNIPEAEVLLQRTFTSYADMQQGAHDLIALGLKNVLLKGGHYEDSQFSQDYWTNGRESFWLTGRRHTARRFSGTGCALSSAIASCMALGYELKDAIVIAKMVVSQAMRLATAERLEFTGWPESECDLPYLSPTPLLKTPEAFPDCGQEPLGLYPIVDNVEWLHQLLPLGVKTAQLRIKSKERVLLEREVEAAIDYAKSFNARLFINDEWEMAIRYGAYGVHLGQSDLETADLSAIRAAGLRLGVSTHCYYEVARAHTLRPSYVACGPIYPTTSKIMPFLPQGIANLHRWRRTLAYPLVAIGGIDMSRMQEVLATNISGVAMISAITQASDPVAMTKQLIELVEQHQLPADELSRYKQQIKLDEIGPQGQMKLKQAKVLCIGAGGLASPLLLYLAAAGVGTIGIVDDDVVEVSNLQRQVLYHSQHVGVKKSIVAEQQLHALNPHIRVQAHTERLSEQNAAQLIADYDVVADCSDNFKTRYLVNDTCVALEKPFVFASISQYEGQCSTFDVKQGPCFRCLFPEAPRSDAVLDCNQGGVLGVLPGILGTLQAAEVMKYILGIGTNLVGRLLTIDMHMTRFREYEFAVNPACEICGHERSTQARPSSSNMIAGSKTNSLPHSISASRLREELRTNDDLFLLDVRTPEEHQRFNLGGKLIPLSELSNRLHELNPLKTIVIYCHAGVRSLHALKILTQANFPQVIHLEGGILAWQQIALST